MSPGVATTHPDYSASLDLWRRCRDTYAGSDAVKAAGETYLPRLSGQDEEEYRAYVTRALFYNGMARTVEGLTGFVFRKDPEIAVPAEVEPDMEDVTLTGVPFPSFCRQGLEEVLLTGRAGVLVDMAEPPAMRPVLRLYSAEDIANWRTTQVDGDTVLTLVVLAEVAEEVDAADIFTTSFVPQFKVLKLDDGGQYLVELWRQAETGDGEEKKTEWVLFRVIEPRRFGVRLDFIPFEFLGPKAGAVEISKAPLLDLADLNLSHYRSSADLEHGRHFTALPTPWVVGFPEDTVLKIGSAVAWVSSNTDAKAGMLEFTGQGLGALERALEAKQSMMATLGARLLEETKAASEAAETVRLRQAGEQSVLQALANAASASMTKVMAWYSEWRGAAGSEVAVKLNTDYISATMTAADLQQMVAAWMAGGMSWETLYANMEAGELTRPGVTAEEEKALIAAEMGSPRLLSASGTDQLPQPAADIPPVTQLAEGPDLDAALTKALAPLFEALNATESASQRMIALEESVGRLREISQAGAGTDIAEVLRSMEARLAELTRAMLVEQAKLDALASRPPQQAPVVNATIVLPKDDKTPLVRTVERNADGLITKITDKPVETQV